MLSIDLNLLRLLLVLSEERSVTKAAERLFISQSAFSHALNRLREQLGDPLFVRTSQGMEATPRAQELIPVIRRSLGQLERGLQGGSQFVAAESARTFYIGAVDYFEFLALPRLVSRFKTLAPNVRLSVDILAEKIQDTGVESGQLDVFVGIEGLQHVPHSFNKRTWLTDRFVAITARQRTDLPARLTLRQFLAEPQVHLPAVISGADLIERWLSAQHQSRTLATIVQSYAVGGRVVASSGYLMCVPLRIAQELVEMLPLRIIELPDGAPELTLTILSHSLYDHQADIRWLIEEISQCHLMGS
ncbi:LysR family transcriptional regulator [Pseudaeromonas paramecii]|uniref:LysR family transcriptional regulator n=1 Tax=Pseudaeromonas paramecii TaxID=2138166 RepID=A0ABP8Q9K8_9GAMM